MFKIFDGQGVCAGLINKDMIESVMAQDETVFLPQSEVILWEKGTTEMKILPSRKAVVIRMPSGDRISIFYAEEKITEKLFETFEKEKIKSFKAQGKNPCIRSGSRTVNEFSPEEIINLPGEPFTRENFFRNRKKDATGNFIFKELTDFLKMNPENLTEENIKKFLGYDGEIHDINEKYAIISWKK